MATTSFKEIFSRWKQLRKSRRFRGILSYMVFVLVAAIFWVLMALNDNMQTSLDIRLHIYNVPKGVTFINDPPEKIHVTVRDRGTQLLRYAVNHNTTLNLNFSDYAQHDIFRLTAPDVYASLRNIFGQGAQISSTSIDSLHLEYTTLPGRRVPIVVVSDVTAAPGYVIAGKPQLSQKSALIYSLSTDRLDAVKSVKTERVTMRNLSESSTTTVKIVGISGVKIVPQKIDVTIPVETLVKKQTVAKVQVENVPAGESLLIFPANAELTCFVPISRFNASSADIVVTADYADIQKTSGGRIPLRVKSTSTDCYNVTLLTDSVEYTIVR